MSVIFQQMAQRSGTTTQWEQANPVLMQGEFGYDTDLDDYKIGNGVDAWDVLTFKSSEPVSPADILDYIANLDGGLA